MRESELLDLCADEFRRQPLESLNPSVSGDIATRTPPKWITDRTFLVHPDEFRELVKEIVVGQQKFSRVPQDGGEYADLRYHSPFGDPVVSPYRDVPRGSVWVAIERSIPKAGKQGQP